MFDFLLEGVLVTQSQSDFRYLVGEIQIKLVNSLKLFFKVLIVENELMILILIESRIGLELLVFLIEEVDLIFELGNDSIEFIELLIEFGDFDLG